MPSKSLHKKKEVFSDIYSSLSKAIKETSWQQMEAGLLVKSITDKGQFVFHVWQIDQAKFAFKVVNQKSSKGLYVSDLLKSGDVILAINGGFFEKHDDQSLTASGLLIADQKKISSYHSRAGSGLFFVKDKQAFIDQSRNYTKESELEALTEALQVGPMVVDPGGKNGILRNDQKAAHRSAICMRNSQVLVIATTAWITLYEFGKLLSDAEINGGLECERALNLDGGPSTQVAFTYGDLKIRIPEQYKVQNAVVVLRRQPADAK